MQVVSSNQAAARPIVIDGSALLWAVHWPLTGTVEDLANGVLTIILNHFEKSDVYLIFDRYYDYNPKGTTRLVSAHNMQHHHHFEISTPLPKQNVALKSTSNKVRLIELICAHILNEAKKCFLGNKFSTQKLCYVTFQIL